MLTKLDPRSVKKPQDLRGLEVEVKQRLEKELPQVKWTLNCAVLGPVDYLDVFDAPDAEAAAKVAMIIRSYGHATTELWTLVPWEKFKNLIPT
jgi:uncharacterized protein with GYD domain